MSLKDLKVTDEEFSSYGVISQPDTLTGTPEENKAVFDALIRRVSIEHINKLIDELSTSGAADMGTEPFGAVTATTVQAALEQIYALIGSTYSGTDGAGKVGYTPSEGVDEDTVQEAIEAVQANLEAYIAKIKAATGAAEVGNALIAGMTATNVQQALEELRENIDNIVSGIIPGGSITSDMLQDGAVTEAKLNNNVVAKLGVLGGATTPQGALAAMGAGVRPNIGDNCCFIGGGTAGKLPVNQRGAISGSTSADSYFIDRWQLQAILGNISYELDTDGLSLTTSEGNQGIKQTLGTALETGKTYTSSVFLANGELLTKTFAYGSVDIVDSYEDGGVWSFAIVKDNDLFVWYPLIEYSGVNTVKPAYVKLEEGSTQTLAYQDEDGAWQLLPQPESDYATQLAKCQRYLMDITPNIAFNPAYFGQTGEGEAVFLVPTPVTMRIAPSVICNPDKIQIALNNGTFPVPTAVSVVLHTQGGVIIRCTVDMSGIAAFSPCDFRSSDITSKILLSAEL